MGLIEKGEKNRVRWKGSMSILDSFNLGIELAKASKELEAIKKEEIDITAYNEVIQSSLTALASKKEYEEMAYVTYEDLSNLSSNKENSGKKLIVIKAPPGTEMEIPEQKEQDCFLRMKSKGDPIMLFTVETESCQLSSSEPDPKEQMESLKNLYAT